ncbi:MAG: hypothetical protein JW779_11050 [Candidatus Thorarchaeota archaeon]|nr:hypothetical protein [Candidatus Thorarchaeota archaeon]
MANDKKIFSTPLVKVKISRFRAPNICPVCGAPSTHTTMISTKPTNKVWLRPSWNPGYSPTSRRRYGISQPQSKIFLIDVCDEHYFTDDANLRFRGFTMCLAALLIGMSVFALMFAGYDLSAGHGIHPLSYLYIVVLSLSIILGFFAFRPTALESAFRIIGFDFDVQYVWLELKNPNYRHKFIEENKAGAELVTWIVKA